MYFVFFFIVSCVERSLCIVGVALCYKVYTNECWLDGYGAKENKNECKKAKKIETKNTVVV